MRDWEKFELECCEYLKEKFGEYATFQHQGAHNSKTPDIVVKTKKGQKFYIEVKDCRHDAQCGQFVLKPNDEDKKFDFSTKNDSDFNEIAQTITSYMNSMFDEFAAAGTAGKKISFQNDQEIFSKWIEDKYKNKGVEFIITNDFNIYRLDKFANAFVVSATYRVKKSGSRNAPKKDFESIIRMVNECFPNVETQIIQGRLYAKTPNDINGTKFNCECEEYVFSEKGGMLYIVNKLSKTKNANVIFTIKHQDQKGRFAAKFDEIIHFINDYHNDY